MHVLHIIPNFRLGEPQLAVLEYARVARMRGIHASVLALSDEGHAVREMLERQLISTQSLSSDAEGALTMQLLQNTVDVIQTHSLADFAAALPAVSDLNVRLVHVFHTRASRSATELPAGNGYMDSVCWVRATNRDEHLGMPNFDELPTILDGVWSPPENSLHAAEQRRAMGVGVDEFCIGAEIGDDPSADIQALKQVHTGLSLEGIDSRVVLFGGCERRDIPEGFTVVSSEDTSVVSRLAGLDTFVQLRDNDFCQLSLLALARRVPVVLPGPDLPGRFRGGWSPFRFSQGDIGEVTTNLLRYASYPDMLDVHRSLVRDYVLTFRDSMSMVGAYARLYQTRGDDCSRAVAAQRSP
ncbi:MAG: hypothetical protein ACQEVA_22270 [Myxococcota bacterium]